MANLDFYSTVADHEAILSDLFQSEEVRVFESYSKLDRDLVEFTQAAEIIDELRRASYPRHAVLLQIWAPAASAKVEIERFAVTVKGHSYRHQISGWGLMQLYLSKETGTEIPPSHFGHFNERGAINRSAPSATTPPNPGSADDWDWKLLRQISRRIQQRIRARASNARSNSRPILRDAAVLMHSKGLLLSK